jgi:sugar phosphate isomerase/epimerase
MKKVITIIFLFSLSLPFFSSRLSAQDEGPGFTSRENPGRVNYREVRIKEFPIAMQCWTFRKFSFYETLEKTRGLGIKYLEAYPGQKLGNGLEGVFDHHMDGKTRETVKKWLGDAGLKIVAYGVVGMADNAGSIKEVFEFAKAMDIQTVVTEPDYDDFSLLEKLAREYNIRVAVHNHPYPSKYSDPLTVLTRVANRDWRLGACGDTGHWMRTGITPVAALRLLKGRLRDIHLKDLRDFGARETRDVPYGAGKASIRDILAELTLQNYGGYLTVEYENEAEALNPSESIRRGIDYLNSIMYFRGYKNLLAGWNDRYSKHGWNQYGPGYFMLDEETGVLESRGGMGLFWYSAEMFENFVLELDFKCSRKITNSGIFLRIPGMVVSDDYIYHSFEVQIDDASESIHHTGAIYDAQAPSEYASKPTGEWNHYKITCYGDNYKVELNGKEIVDWKAEPRGKIRDFSRRGYIGIQNHDSRSPVFIRNVYIKELPD